MAKFLEIYTVTDFNYQAAQLIAGGDRLSKVTPPLVRRFGRELQRRVKENASGRPGPEVVTGAYRDSIKYRTFPMPAGIGVEVYSQADQSFRLEYGFVGVDSLGRHYNQPPFPHFVPAILSITDEFYDAVNDAVGKALGNGR